MFVPPDLSGILYPGKHGVIGNGVVVDPKVLTDEIAELHRRNVDISGLRIRPTPT